MIMHPVILDITNIIDDEYNKMKVLLRHTQVGGRPVCVVASVHK
jgi:hypothetical protein